MPHAIFPLNLFWAADCAEDLTYSTYLTSNNSSINWSYEPFSIVASSSPYSMVCTGTSLLIKYEIFVWDESFGIIFCWITKSWDGSDFSQNFKRILAKVIVSFVRLVTDGMIRKALTYREIFFRSSLGSVKIMSGLATDTLVQKYFSSSSCIQLNEICLWFCRLGLAAAGKTKNHKKIIKIILECRVRSKIDIIYTSTLPFFLIFLLTVDQISLASTVSNSNFRPLSFFSFSSLK